METTTNEELEAITDLQDWPLDAIYENLKIYEWNARYENIWEQRVQELSAEMARRGVGRLDYLRHLYASLKAD